MHLHDLDVVIGQRFGRLLHKRCQQIDAKTHISRFHDDGFFRGFRDLRVVFGRTACRADDVGDLRVGSQRRQCHRNFRRGEIDDYVGVTD
jgi:hypothetical protein